MADATDTAGVAGVTDVADDGIEVIYDSGRGVPASPYLTYLVNVDPHGTGEVMAGLRFPIRTRLVPGLLARECPVFDPDWQAQPIFVVGADPRSMGWLSFNRARLWRVGAWGLVVRADSARAFRALQTVAPKLKYAPSLGEWLDARLIGAGADVYPLFIGIDGVAVQILPEALYGPASAPGNDADNDPHDDGPSPEDGP